MNIPLRLFGLLVQLAPFVTHGAIQVNILFRVRLLYPKAHL